jgi:hypothetical protein
MFDGVVTQLVFSALFYIHFCTNSIFVPLVCQLDSFDFRFLHPSRPALGPTQPPVQWLPSFLPRVKRPGSGINHTSPFSAEVKERIELYFCSPSGPSWPVLGWTSLFFFGTIHYYWFRFYLTELRYRAWSYRELCLVCACEPPRLS